jgi:hypothetical protein
MEKVKRIRRSNTRIDKLMHDNGINTDRVMAVELNLSYKTLSYRLRSNITMSTLEMFADYFDVSIKYLIR